MARDISMMNGVLNYLTRNNPNKTYYTKDCSHGIDGDDQFFGWMTNFVVREKGGGFLGIFPRTIARFTHQPLIGHYNDLRTFDESLLPKAELQRLVQI